MTTPQEVSICAKHVRGLAIHGGSWAVLDRAADMLEELARLKEVELRGGVVFDYEDAELLLKWSHGGNPKDSYLEQRLRQVIVAYLGGEK